MEKNLVNMLLAQHLAASRKDVDGSELINLLLLVDGDLSSDTMIRIKYLIFKTGLETVSGLDNSNKKVLKEVFALYLKKKANIENLISILLKSNITKCGLSSDEIDGIRGFAKKIVTTNSKKELYEIYTYVTSNRESIDDDMSLFI